MLAGIGDRSLPYLIYIVRQNTIAKVERDGTPPTDYTGCHICS